MQTQRNVSLKRFSTFQIGGRARVLITVYGVDELVKAVLQLERDGERYRVFSGGSNVVFPDRGTNVTLVRVSGGGVSVHRAGFLMEADAGVPLGKVVARAISLGWSGLESLSGIPGTVGGAVVGNAGAYGHSISEVVLGVETVHFSHDRGKSVQFRRRWLDKSECGFLYRESVFKHESYVVLRVRLRLRAGEAKELRRASREIVALREKKYKPGLKCPGSFFKNVLVKDVSARSLSLIDPSKIIDGKIPAGWLLERVGARGFQIGGIKIADFHGNLFVNTGRGRAADVKRLARLLKARVKRKFGIVLEEEIRYF